MGENSTLKEIINKGEEFSEHFLRRSKYIIPHVARFCLISTFLEDGMRMYSQWGEQREFMEDQWSCGWFFASLFVLINLVGQMVGSFLILARKQVNIGCIILMFIIFVQTIGYSILWDLHFLLRNLALVGGVMLLIAEARPQDHRSLFAGVPDPFSATQRDRPYNYMQLSGRLLLVLMYLTLLKFELSVFNLLHTLTGLLLILAVAVGYKTKLSAFVLVVLLFSLNIYLNHFWTYSSDRPMHDFLKYDFFQTLSVIGGLLLIVALGPGGVSLDEYKKDT